MIIILSVQAIGAMVMILVITISIIIIVIIISTVQVIWAIPGLYLGCNLLPLLLFLPGDHHDDHADDVGDDDDEEHDHNHNDDDGCEKDDFVDHCDSRHLGEIPKKSPFLFWKGKLILLSSGRISPNTNTCTNTNTNTSSPCCPRVGSPLGFEQPDSHPPTRPQGFFPNHDSQLSSKNDENQTPDLIKIYGSLLMQSWGIQRTDRSCTSTMVNTSSLIEMISSV